MRAIDTNIVVRVVTADDPVQSPLARAVVAAGDVLVPITVILEAAWVLRRFYGYNDILAATAMHDFSRLPGVAVEHADRLAPAVAHAGRGMDFADALHLAAAEGCEALLTFDRAFVQASAGAGGPPVRDASA